MDSIQSALDYLNPAGLTYTDWITVGMALKEEGFPCAVWDEWSRNDERYRPGECERKWGTFAGSPSPVKGGTVIRMARERGWSPSGGSALGRDDEINSGPKPPSPEPGALPPLTPVRELRTYLETLFRPDEFVSYVTFDSWQGKDGRWNPGTGVSDRTAGELIASLDRNPDDLGATIGDWKPECGAWIRFNPVDGRGVKNENVTRFTYALVESDSMPVAEQESLIRSLELPVACLVHSGGKSIHAIVRVDAPDAAEYRRRVAFLYDFLGRNGMAVDRQNSNPSRLSRLPGATRGGGRQRLLATGLGRRSWDEWQDFIEGVSDGLPGFEPLSDFTSSPPALPGELIEGILRSGHKMLISGSSKAGKSFLLMELCISIAEGLPWLGFSCRKGRVLYVNLEIDKPSCIDRFLRIYSALGIKPVHASDIELWNLRGKALPLDSLVPKMLRRMRSRRYDAVIIDPIYKILMGDENSASDMGRFCNEFDRICAASGCAVIYCHHHSKGAQGQKKAMDRASGSGVFSRDPDAQLDMIALEMTDDVKNCVADDGATAWRLESSLREFRNIKPLNFWFRYPLHVLDTSEELSCLPSEGSREGNLSKSGRRTSPGDRRRCLDTSFEICAENGAARISDMAEYLGLSSKTLARYVDEYPDDFVRTNGLVTRVDKAPAALSGSGQT